MLVELADVTVAVCPLNVTEVSVARLSPLIETTELLFPMVGENPVTIAPLPVRKLLVVVKLPLEVVTLIGPVVAPLGTVALIWVVDVTVLLAETPLNVTPLTL
jgi:hypothetical protein